MEYFNYYCLPAVAALILKLLLLAATRVMPLRNTESRVFLAFLFALALHNTSEIMVFNYAGPQDGIIPLRAGYLYFTMSIVAIGILLHLMLVRLRNSTGWDVPVDQMRGWLYIPGVALIVLLWRTDDVVRGFVPHAYSYTHVPGNLYVLFQVYAIGYLIASISILVVAAIYSANTVYRRKNAITLLGMFPMTALPIVVIVLQSYGINVFNLLVWFPLALTFFLVITAYAIYEHRLFNIFFHLPGTRLYRRHTAFHRRIMNFLAELDGLPSVSVEEALNGLAVALRCNVALVSDGKEPVQGEPSSSHSVSGHLDVDRLPVDDLRKIDSIVLTKEMEKQDPEIYSVLSGANCAAVMPFRPFKGASAGWLLLGGARNAPEELPIDFSIVEDLFDKMGDLFLENMVTERNEVEMLNKLLDNQLSINRHLNDELQRKQAAIDSLYNQYAAGPDNPSTTLTLDDMVAGLEKKMISDTLLKLNGNVSATAKSLGLTRQTLYAKMESYGIEHRKMRNSRKKNK